MTATRAPAPANLRAQAAPMPLPPPVIRTILPVKSRTMGPCSAIVSAGDKAVDLAIMEQPALALLDHPVGVAAPRADFRPVRAVLYDGPVRAHLGRLAVEFDDDVGHEMDRAGTVVAGAGADVARKLCDCRAAGTLAEGGLPGAVLGEERGHAVVIAAVEPEAIFCEYLADRIFFFQRRHRSTLICGRLVPAWFDPPPSKDPRASWPGG